MTHLKPWREPHRYEIQTDDGPFSADGIRLSKNWATRQLPGGAWSLDHLPTGYSAGWLVSVDDAETLADYIEAHWAEVYTIRYRGRDVFDAPPHVRETVGSLTAWTGVVP